MAESQVPLATSIVQLLRSYRSDDLTEVEASNAVVAAIEAAVADETHRTRAETLSAQEELAALLEATRKERDDAKAVASDLSQELETVSLSSKRDREALVQLEYQREGLLREIESLGKDKTILKREVAELKSRLDDETGNYESLKADWKSKETGYLDAIKSQRRATRDASNFQRSLTPPQPGSDDATLLSARRPSTIQEDVQLRLLKSQISERDVKIETLSAQVEELRSIAKMKEEEADMAKNDSGFLRQRMDELEQALSKLQEENQLFEVLLGRGLKSGEGVPMLKSIENSESDIRKTGSIEDEIVARGTIDGLGETPSERQLKSEVKALTLYIDKILTKMMTNPDVAAALLMHPDDEDEASEKDLNRRPEGTKPVAPAREASVGTPLSPGEGGISSRSSFLSIPAAAIEMVRSVSSGKRGSIVPVPFRTGSQSES